MAEALQTSVAILCYVQISFSLGQCIYISLQPAQSILHLDTDIGVMDSPFSIYVSFSVL